jgi:hypothetical protein
MENRAEKRHPESAPIIFSPFTSQNWCPDNAEVENFSTAACFFYRSAG